MQDVQVREVSAVPDAPFAAPPCLNCGTAVPLAFCGACGQPITTARLTMRQLFHDFASGFLKMETRVLHTTRDLVLRPSRLIMDYLAGRRTAYVGPIQYLLLVLAAMLVVSALLDFSPVAHLFTDGLPEEFGPQDGWWTRFPMAVLFLSFVLPSVPAAWAYGRLRPKADHTLAERLVVILYVDALSLLYLLVLEPLLALAFGGVSPGLTHAVLSLLFMGLWAWVGRTVLRESAWAVTWKITVAMLSIGVALFIVSFVIAFGVGLTMRMLAGG